MSKHTTHVTVLNQFGEKADRIKLTWGYDDKEYVKEWYNVAPGEWGEGWLLTYEDYFGGPYSYWHIDVVFPTAWWWNDGTKRCSLTEDDADTVLYFGVSELAGFQIQEHDSCHTALVKHP